MSEDEQRDVHVNGSGGLGADRHARGDRHVIELGATGQLSRYELDAVPVGKLVAGNPHRRDRPMMAEVVKTFVGQTPDKSHVRLIRRAMRILIGALVGGPVEGLGVFLLPSQDLVHVHHHLTVLDPGREAMQPLVVVVR